MPNQKTLRETKQHGAAWFPFNIYPCTIPQDFPQVALHWQDSMELVFVKKGRGIVQAGLTTYTACCLCKAAAWRCPCGWPPTTGAIPGP